MSQRAALEALARGLEMALVGIRQLLDAPDPQEWVDQARSPLGRRRHLELARGPGALAGARKVGTKWLIKRKDLDVFIGSHERGDRSEGAEVAAILSFRAPSRKKPRKPSRKEIG